MGARRSGWTVCCACIFRSTGLSDPAVEEALYDSLSMRRFVGIDLGREPAPDETTIPNFRHLLETHELGERVNRWLDVAADIDDSDLLWAVERPERLTEAGLHVIALAGW
jgi:hypothetical protein